MYKCKFEDGTLYGDPAAGAAKLRFHSIRGLALALLALKRTKSTNKRVSFSFTCTERNKQYK